MIRNSLLDKILSQPSAPFRELHVIGVLKEELSAHGVPHFTDPVGNVVVGAKSKQDYLALVQGRGGIKKTTSRASGLRGAVAAEPVRVFIAHMDHPGFHGVSWRSEQELEFKWHGGSPSKHLEGAAVWLASAEGGLEPGKLTQASLIASGNAIDQGRVQTPRGLCSRFPDATKLYGGFSFRSPVWREGELVYTKAADDLVGAFAIVSLAIELFKQKSRPPFLGLLTRAEEVGFIGAIGHFELGWLAKAKRPVLCVSLETSRALPGAEIGKGPVVRLGDKFTVFSSEALHTFTELAKTVLPDRHQRRVMDGGTCEATAATVYGFPCVGISVPLGNYHNQSFEGGPDSAGPLGPAPEFVHAGDIEGLITLCHALLKPKLPWGDPWNAKLKIFKSQLHHYRALLRSGP